MQPVSGIDAGGTDAGGTTARRETDNLVFAADNTRTADQPTEEERTARVSKYS